MNSSSNIVLIGFMGSGKSTVGRILAGNTKRYFIDSDALIETSENRTIKAIFETDGEAYYRNLEAECFEWMRHSLQNSVISTGGGMPIHIKNLNTLGPVVFLDVDFDTVQARVASKEAQKRPLASDEVVMKSLYGERQAYYRTQADIVVDAGGRADQVAESIIRAFS